MSGKPEFLSVEVKYYYDEATFTLTYLVYDSFKKDAVIIDPVLNYDWLNGGVVLQEEDEDGTSYYYKDMDDIKFDKTDYDSNIESDVSYKRYRGVVLDEIRNQNNKNNV